MTLVNFNLTVTLLTEIKQHGQEKSLIDEKLCIADT